jgi:hypothetical protein
MFLLEQGCRAARVLEENDCPLHGVVHDLLDFPNFHDALYYFCRRNPKLVFGLVIFYRFQSQQLVCRRRSF